MWDTAKQQALDDLQERAWQGTLSEDERQKLENLLYDLELAEWAALRPGLDRLRQEQERLQADLGQAQAQNAVLSAIAERYADLLARAKVQLAGLGSEREALRTEYKRALR